MTSLTRSIDRSQKRKEKRSKHEMACRQGSLIPEHFTFAKAGPDKPVTVRGTTYQPEHLSPLSVTFQTGDESDDTGFVVYLRDRCGDILRYSRTISTRPNNLSDFLKFGGILFFVAGPVIAQGLSLLFTGTTSTTAAGLGLIIGLLTPIGIGITLGEERLSEYGIRESTKIGYYTGRPPTFKTYEQPGVLLQRMREADRISQAGQRFLQNYGNDQRSVVVEGVEYTLSALPSGQYLIKPEDEIVPKLKTKTQLQRWLEQHNEHSTTGLPEGS